MPRPISSNTPGDAHFSRYIQPAPPAHCRRALEPCCSVPGSSRKKLRNAGPSTAIAGWAASNLLSVVVRLELAVFGMAVVSKEGLPTHLGFGILAVPVVRDRPTGVTAWCEAANIAVHRQWMIRKLRVDLGCRHSSPVHSASCCWSCTGLSGVPTLRSPGCAGFPMRSVAEWMVRRRGVGILQESKAFRDFRFGSPDFRQTFFSIFPFFHFLYSDFMDRANILIIGGGVQSVCAIANAVSNRWQDVFSLLSNFRSSGMATSNAQQRR